MKDRVRFRVRFRVRDRVRERVDEGLALPQRCSTLVPMCVLDWI